MLETDPISLEDISKFNEEWIIEEVPAGLTDEEVATFRTELTSSVPDCKARGSFFQTICFFFLLFSAHKYITNTKISR